MRILWPTIFLIFLVAGGDIPVYSQQKIEKDLVITLERSVCYGSCPSYSLTINSDGAVRFTPLENPVYRGEADGPKLPLEGSIAVDKLNELLTEFEKIKFYSLRKQYGSAGNSKTETRCRVYMTDFPSAKISIIRNGKKKSVYHCLGCHGPKILDALTALEDKIDETVDVKRWTSQYGWGAASVWDVQLKKEPLPPTKPQ
ncbi:MAG: DUF6438 domain-containing protein [Pyrinomonadaceae bacterium]